MAHPALMKSSGWQWNRRKSELDAARWWGGLTPGQFDALSKDEKLDIIALYEIEWRVDVVNAWEQHQEAKRKANRGKR